MLGGQRPGSGGEQGVRGSDAIALDNDDPGLDGLGQHVVSGEPGEVVGTQVAVQSEGEDQPLDRRRPGRQPDAQQLLDVARDRQVAGRHRLLLDGPTHREREERVAAGHVVDPPELVAGEP